MTLPACSLQLGEEPTTGLSASGGAPPSDASGDGGSSTESGGSGGGTDVSSGGETEVGSGGGTDVSSGGGVSSLPTELTIEEGDVGQCTLDGVVESVHVGFTGTGYMNVDNNVGAGAEWAVSIGQAGTYVLEFAYASEPATDRAGEVLVDGVVAVDAVSFPSTGSWTNYSPASADVSLAVGEHIITLQATQAEGLANIDSLTVKGASVAASDCN